MIRELQQSDPRQVGRYRIIGRLGQGGMGQVFLGQSPAGKQVAEKLIRAEHAENAEFRARFALEVAAARRVSGAYTAPVIDADVASAQPWLVTDYVPGPSLDEAVMAQGGLPAEEVVWLAARLAEGLGVIHAAGVVHRDLKPSNVLMGVSGPLIIDFGVSLASDAIRLTQTGMIVGTAEFMSPEHTAGRAVSWASDIFSLGSVLTFAATCRSPFGSGPAGAVLYRIVHEAPVTDGVPDQIKAIIESCLSKDPARRPTADGFLAAVLAAARPDRPWSGQRQADPPTVPATLPSARSADGELSGAPAARQPRPTRLRPSPRPAFC